jgi:hypothetical protein
MANVIFQLRPVEGTPWTIGVFADGEQIGGVQNGAAGDGMVWSAVDSEEAAVSEGATIAEAANAVIADYMAP